MKKCMGCMEEFDEMQTVCPHCGYLEGTKPVEVYTSWHIHWRK